jgi:hypothetical protein
MPSFAPRSRPVISSVAQFDNITTRREIIQCHGLALVLGHWQRWLGAGSSSFHAGATSVSIYAGITDSMNAIWAAR